MDTKTFDAQRATLRQVRETINGTIRTVMPFFNEQFQKSSIQAENLMDAMQKMAQAEHLLLEAAAILSNPNEEASK